jgi:uncharacterized protein YyaL (SSP411 family)
MNTVQYSTVTKQSTTMEEAKEAAMDESIGGISSRMDQSIGGGRIPSFHHLHMVHEAMMTETSRGGDDTSHGADEAATTARGADDDEAAIDQSTGGVCIPPLPPLHMAHPRPG